MKAVFLGEMSGGSFVDWGKKGSAADF